MTYHISQERSLATRARQAVNTHDNLEMESILADIKDTLDEMDDDKHEKAIERLCALQDALESICDGLSNLDYAIDEISEALNVEI